jgi:hypothetical protein
MGAGKMTPWNSVDDRDPSRGGPQYSGPRKPMPEAWERFSSFLRKSSDLSWCGPILIALVFLSLTAWTWRKWPDLLIDFGRELYVPWQLLEGKVLYRDIAYVSGPLSPYVNALWFKIAGVSLTNLIFFNIVILGLITGLLYYVINKSTGRFTAVLSCVAFLIIFAFGHIVQVGNYNFICPYSHELTHGILLSLILIILLTRIIEHQGFYEVFLSGLCLGMIFLGKGEVFLAAAGAAGVGLFLMTLAGKVPPLRMCALYLAFACAALIPVGLFFLYFTGKMSAVEALRGTAGTWSNLLGNKVSNNQFYQMVMGLDHPWHNFGLMVLDFCGIGLMFGSFFLSNSIPQRSTAQKIMLGLFIVLFTIVFLLKRTESPLLVFNRALPLSALVAFVFLMISAIKNRRDPIRLTRLALLAMWAALGLGLLAKICLNAHVWHYGFVLAMPAAILLIMVFVGLLPKMMSNSQGQAHHWQRILVAVIIADMVLCWRLSMDNYAKKNFPIGSNGDVILAYDPNISLRGYAVAQLLAYLASSVPSQATLAVLPEGIMINYLTRHLNPTPYINCMPPELLIFGEKSIVCAFQNQAPDFIILIHKDTQEYGADFFGKNPSYGKLIMDWISSHYTPVWQILDEPLKDHHFGIKVMQRKNSGFDNVKGLEGGPIVKGFPRAF